MIPKCMYLLKMVAKVIKAIKKLQSCILDIKQWSTQNDLKLNADKTEVLHFTSKFRESHQIEFFPLDDAVIDTPSDSARNLGVRLDKHLTMNSHVNETCRAAAFALHKIGSIVILTQYDNFCTKNLLRDLSMHM